MQKRVPTSRSIATCCVLLCLASALRDMTTKSESRADHRSVPHHSTPVKCGNTSLTGCGKTFLKYQPSGLEESWKAMISELKSDDVGWKSGCDKLLRELEAHKRVIHGIEQHAAGVKGHPPSWNLSSHVFLDTCTGQESVVPIEPLVSFLRHPLAHCYTEKRSWWYSIFGGRKPADFNVDKSYLLVPFVHQVGAQSSHKWFFDVGASTYDTGFGGASQSWFVDMYRARGFDFDRIYGWEAALTNP